MFSLVSNASKIALVCLCAELDKLGFTMIDCQQTSDHLISLGAQEIPRTEFCALLEAGLLDDGQLRSTFPQLDPEGRSLASSF